MQQLESLLSIEYIQKVRLVCSAKKERIKLLKIHGGNYQTMGVADYLGWYKGKGLVIEFKVDANLASPIQLSFLQDVINCGGLGIIITFIKNIKTKLTPYEQINSLINLQTERILFLTYGYQGKSITLPKL